MNTNYSEHEMVSADEAATQLRKMFNKIPASRRSDAVTGLSKTFPELIFTFDGDTLVITRKRQ